ncbi:MAG: ATP-binding cassette domain-containing protein, partial [Henriciella sp.]|nr:ATP-binding cassette domain-containing protein [Henriciella sp.]
YQRARLGVGYLPQEPKLDESKTVFENIASQCPEKQIFDKFNEISMKLGEEYTDELMEEMTALQEQVDQADAWDIDSKIEMAMVALGCPEGDASVTNLSGGEIRRVAICQLLLSKPDMIRWTNRPTTSTLRRSPGSRTISSTFRAV